MTNDARALLPDITGRADVHDLVVDFYREVVFDDVLSPVFGEVAEVDWAEHIPKLIDYWCRVLFGDPGYRGAILRPHQRINELERFESAMFDRCRWIADGTGRRPIGRDLTPPVSRTCCRAG